MTKSVNAMPEAIDIEPSKHLESYLAGQSRVEQSYLVQIAVFSELGGPTVTLSFTTQDDRASQRGTAEATSSFTLSIADARKLADALRKAIGEYALAR